MAWLGISVSFRNFRSWDFRRLGSFKKLNQEPGTKKHEQRRRRILLVVPVYASYHCFLREVAEALVEGGWKVAVACDLSVAMGQEREPEREAGIAFYNWRSPRGFEPLSYLRTRASLRRIIREFQPEVVHAHFSAAILAVALAGGKGVPFTGIGTFQGLQFPLAEGIRKSVYRWAEVFASKRLKGGCWVLTRDDLGALDEAGVPNAHLQGAYGFGCRIDVFDPERFPREVRSGFRKKWRIADDEPVFAFVGRNVRFKGFALVVRAFFRLIDSGRRARLLIVGDRDPLHPSGLNDDEERRMKEVAEIVRCGWQRDVAPFLAITDALVHPSSREGMPVGCMEAIAMGVRLIAPERRGLRELLEITGQTPLPELSETAIAEAMERVIEENDRGEQRNGWDREKIRGYLDRYAYVEEQMGIYNRLVKGKDGD